jgi:hypothetical protein
MRITRNSNRTGEDGEPLVPAMGGQWDGPYPGLVEFLTATRWENGDQRVPGTVTLFTDGSVWKMCLSDKDSGLMAFVTAECPESVLVAANKGLETGSLDWRAQKDRQRNNRR